MTTRRYFLPVTLIASLAILWVVNSSSPEYVSLWAKQLHGEELSGAVHFELPIDPGYIYRIRAHQHELDINLIVETERMTKTSDIYLWPNSIEHVAIETASSTTAKITLTPNDITDDGRLEIRAERLKKSLFSKAVGDLRRADITLSEASDIAYRSNGAFWENHLPQLIAASETYRRHGDTQGAAMAMFMASLQTYGELGDWVAAERLAEQGLDLASKESQNSIATEFITIMGLASIEAVDGNSSQQTLERRQRGVDYLKQVIALYEKQNRHYSKIWALNSLGIAFLYMDEWSRGVDAFERAATLALRQGASTYYAMVMTNLSVLTDASGELRAARDSLREITRSPGELRDSQIANALDQLASVELRLGNWESAIAALSKAISYSPILNNADRARIRSRLASAYLQTSNLERASVYIQAALEEIDDIDEYDTKLFVHRTKATLLAARGNLLEATRHYRKWLPNVGSNRERALWLMDLVELAWQQGDFNEATLLAEEARAISSSNRLRAQAQTRLAYSELMSSYSDSVASDHLIEALDQDPRIEQTTIFVLSRALLAAHSGDVNTALTIVQDLIERAWSRRLNTPIDEVKKGLVSDLQMAIDTTARISDFADTGSERALAFELVDGARAEFKLVSNAHRPMSENAKALAEKINELRYQYWNTATSEKQRRTITASLEEHYRIRDISESMDEIEDLSYSIPAVDWSLLPDDAVLVEYWIPQGGPSLAWVADSTRVRRVELAESRRIADLTNRWINSIANPHDRPDWTAGLELNMAVIAPLELDRKQAIWIVADGVLRLLPFATLPLSPTEYLTDHHTIHYLPSLSSLRLPREAERSYDFVGFAASTEDVDLGLSSLPGAEEELSLASSYFPEARIRIWTAEQATADAFLNSLDIPSRFLHVATHGLIDPTAPSLSALYFSGTGKNGRMVYANEIEQHEVVSELVVLSACDTARGRLVPTRSVEGLASAFLTAGADSVLVSLWRAPDMLTGSLMSDFYREIGESIELPKALQTAQQLIRMRDHGRYGHPYYWGGWKLVANVPYD